MNSLHVLANVANVLALTALSWFIVFLTLHEHQDFSSWLANRLEAMSDSLQLGRNTATIWSIVIVFLGFGSFFAYTAIALSSTSADHWRWAHSPLHSRLLQTVIRVPFLGYLKVTEIIALVVCLVAQCVSMVLYYKRREDRALSRGSFDSAARLMALCRAFGVGLAVDLAFALIPICKHSFWLEFFDIGFERAVKWHRLLGWLVLLFSALHTAFGVLSYVAEGALLQCMGWSEQVPNDGRPCRDKLVSINIYGQISLACGLVLGLTALERFRRWWYRLFYIAHWLWIPFMVFGAIHDSSVFIYAIPGLVSYFVDKTISAGRLVAECELTRAENIGDLTRLSLKVERDSYPLRGYAQWVYVNVPVVSALEWHPMSIASFSPETDVLVLDIRHVGKWSKALAKQVGTLELQRSMRVRLNGPFGGSSHLTGKDAILFVSGGIGLTAHLLAASHLCKSDKRCTLVWVTPSSVLMQTQLERLQVLHELGCDVHVYCTGSATDVCRELDTVHVHPRQDVASSWRKHRFASPFSKFCLVIAGVVGIVLGFYASSQIDTTEMSFGWGRLSSILATSAISVAVILATVPIALLFQSCMVWRPADSNTLRPGKEGQTESGECDTGDFMIEQGSKSSGLDASTTSVNVSTGRPNIASIVNEWVLKSSSQGKVSHGVFVCGPSPIVSHCFAACAHARKKYGVKITMEEEPYGF